MFCTRCGTQVEAADNFCKNCGAGLRRSAESISASERSTTEPERLATLAEKSNVVQRGSTEPGLFPPSHERKGISGMTIIVSLAVLIIAAGAGVYFGTDLFREPAKEESAAVAEPPEHGAGAPDSSFRTETKQTSEAGDHSLASALQSPPPNPSPSDSVESSSPPAKSSPKPAHNTDVSPTMRKPQVDSPAQKAPASLQANKGQPASPVSRRAAVAGTYETKHSTSLFESPSASSAVIANIPGGMRLDVVGSNGDWLEVHSKRGNPPGFIRRQDATFIEKTD